MPTSLPIGKDDPAAIAAKLIAELGPPPPRPADDGRHDEWRWWLWRDRPHDGSRWWGREGGERAFATGLGKVDLFLYWVLDSYTRPGQPVAWPAITTLASQMGCSSRTVNRHLNDLEEQGWIIRRQGEGQKGHGGTTTLYVIADPPLPDHWATIPCDNHPNCERCGDLFIAPPRG